MRGVFRAGFPMRRDGTASLIVTISMIVFSLRILYSIILIFQFFIFFLTIINRLHSIEHNSMQVRLRIFVLGQQLYG